MFCTKSTKTCRASNNLSYVPFRNYFFAPHPDNPLWRSLVRSDTYVLPKIQNCNKSIKIKYLRIRLYLCTPQVSAGSYTTVMLENTPCYKLTKTGRKQVRCQYAFHPHFFILGVAIFTGLAPRAPEMLTHRFLVLFFPFTFLYPPPHTVTAIRLHAPTCQHPQKKKNQETLLSKCSGSTAAC